MIVEKDGEGGWLEHRLKRHVKTNYLPYWEEIIDLMPGADVYSTQGPSQDFSLHGTEMVGGSP